MKRNLAVGLVLLMAVSAASAAPIQSDNFDDGVIGAQWAAPAITGTATVAESSGTLNMVATGDGSKASMVSTSGYVLSGDFDITIDLNVNSFNRGTGIAIAGFVAQSTAGQFMSLQHRHAGGVWYEIAFVTNGTYKANFSALEDVQYRIQRTGSLVTGSVMLPGGWAEVNNLSTFGTNDVKLEMYTWNFSGAQLMDVSFDNLSVPEPTTVGLLAVGALGVIRRRK